MGTETTTQRAFAERILFGATLEDKLASPAAVVHDAPGRAPLGAVEQPGRPAELRLGQKLAPPFPKREALGEPRARGQVLHFFANHELLALELMALALLRFPDAEPGFRDGIVRTMLEEQAHLRLYLGRMEELGVRFGELAVSEFFWRALKDMRDPVDYVAGMSLTFEQANLDFSLHYRDLFAQLGDEVTAGILERVYREEIGHVKHGLAWFDRWRTGGTLWQRYVESLQLPLSPARAKAVPFSVEGRRAAGLDEDFIRRLALFGGSKGRPPDVLWFNPDVELEVAHVCAAGKPRAWDAYQTKERHAEIALDGELLPTFLAKDGDVVLCRREPPLALLEDWQRLGFALPEYRVVEEPVAAVGKLAKERALGELRPWGFGPRAWKAAAPEIDRAALRARLQRLFAKTELPALRARCRSEVPGLAPLLGPEAMDGRLVTDEASLRAALAEAAALGCPLLVKAPFSAAGRDRLRLDAWDALDERQRAWLAKGWRLWGALLAEPAVAIVREGSLVGDLLSPAAPVETSFLADARGQYLGHWLARPAPPSDPLRSVGGHVAHMLRDAGHRGRYGLDFFLYRLPHSATPEREHLQPVSEINARTTMGHVAARLGRALAPGVTGLWLTLRRETVLPALPDLAAAPRRADSRGLKAGVFFTNDPATARQTVGVVAAGATAVTALRQLAGLVLV